MIEWIQHADRVLFLIFNAKVANPILDAVMPYITDVDHWTIPILLIWLYLLIFCGTKGRWAALSIVLLITLSDQLASSVIKQWIGRLRPCHPDFPLQGARFLIGMKTSFSMPSSHASNITAMATFFSTKYPRTRWIVITIAVLICWSRVYVGVHYPSDVLVGVLLGFGCAHFILLMERVLSRLWKQRQERKQTPEEATP